MGPALRINEVVIHEDLLRLSEHTFSATIFLTTESSKGELTEGFTQEEKLFKKKKLEKSLKELNYL